MKILLDTHILIWTLFESNSLKIKERELLLNPKYEILVSSVSLWEISLKYQLGKLQLENIHPDQLPEEINKMGFNTIDLNISDASTYYKLPKLKHADPFDRMLVWQAIQNKCSLFSKDKAIKQYKNCGLTILSV